MNTAIPFTKMVGTGNDFIVVDARRHHLNGLSRQWKAISQSLCDRHTGIGADGILILQPSRAATAKMRVFNPDGSEAEMCGNGARCVALYLVHSPQSTVHSPKHVALETVAGIISATVKGNRVATWMMEPTELQLGQALEVNKETVRYGFVNTGVPHLVVPVSKLDALDVNRLGPPLRYHRRFAPHGANVNFIQPDPRHRNRVLVRTYERGVEEETLACGTGIVASAIIQALSQGKTGTHHIQVHARSGDVLAVSFSAERSGSSWRIHEVMMEGPAQRVFDGEVSWPPRSS